MNPKRDDYIPALKSEWLTGFYDFFIRWTTREARFKQRLISEARIEKGQHILDLGCGTATLTLFIKQRYPD
jgi:ubiquinone/menaquinone biosynthesis C-methylase UbiE